MRLIKDSGICLFEKRKFPAGKDLPVNAGMPGTLLLQNGNGQWRFPLEGGKTAIPFSVFAEGENRLTLQTKDGVFPCETVIRRGNRLSPAGFDPAPHTLSLLSRLEKAEAEISALRARLAEVETGIRGYTLFGAPGTERKGT